MVTCTDIVNNHERVKGLRLENIMAKVGGRLCCGRGFTGADVHRVRQCHWPTPNRASAFAGQNELYYTERRNTELLSFRLPTARCLAQQIRSGLMTDDKAAGERHDKLGMDVDWVKGCFLSG